MSGLPSYEEFRGQIGQGFLLDYPDHRETLTLVSATRAKHTPPPGLPHGFDLIFEGESWTVMLGQAIYVLETPGLGRIELFLACIGPLPGGGFRYQAVVN
jgi:hypothetical protein